MATPLNMPARKSKRVVRVTMAARHAHCQDKGNCKGPGCKAATGKSMRDRLPADIRDEYRG